MNRARDVETMTDEELVEICGMILQAALDKDILPRDIEPIASAAVDEALRRRTIRVAMH